MSEIIFWRHADAHDANEGQDDLERRLTVKGQRQAERVASWLDRNLPQQCRVFASPAKRSQQTVRCLPRKCKTLTELSPGARPEEVLAAVGWGVQTEPLVIVGHQPWIGECIHWLLMEAAVPMTVRKGAAWWLQSRDREGENEVIVRAVATPELL
ncbi:MAG: histidine phosphatase family protein [Casimicrobium sp.]